MAVVPLLEASRMTVMDLDEREVLIVANAILMLVFVDGR